MIFSTLTLLLPAPPSTLQHAGQEEELLDAVLERRALHLPRNLVKTGTVLVPQNLVLNPPGLLQYCDVSYPVIHPY